MSNKTNTSENDLYLGSVTRLVSLFYKDVEELGTFEAVKASEMPADYQALLAHTDHMTVTLEAFHNSLVDVRVLAEHSDDSYYARNSVLARQSDGMPVQFGIVRIWLADLPEEARQGILEKKIPLGRVLIRHNVMRAVELLSFWRIEPAPAMRECMELEEGQQIFGRSAQILVHHRPTMQLLEIARV